MSKSLNCNEMDIEINNHFVVNLIGGIAAYCFFRRNPLLTLCALLKTT